MLNINLDMIGTYMGKFIACVSAEEKLSHYITYMAAEVGFPVESRPASTPVIPPRLRTRVSRPYPLHATPAAMSHRFIAGTI